MPKIHLIDVTPDEAGLRLDKWFHHKYPHLPFSQVQKLCRSGQLRVNGKRTKSNVRVSAGDKIRWPEFDQPQKNTEAPKTKPPTKKQQQLAQTLLDNILFEDKKYLVFNKPAGLAVQGGPGIQDHVDSLLPFIAAAKGFTDHKLHLTHRIDKETSGILIVAKSSLAAKKLADAFKNRDVQKTYLALCDGLPAEMEGTIESKLQEQKKGGERFMVSDRHEGKKAITHFDCLDHAHTKASLLQLSPHTGRTHQLRVHCADLGCPIFGDDKYHPNTHKNDPMLLHAWQFSWPERGWQIKAPLPTYFCQKLKTYGLRQPS